MSVRPCVGVGVGVRVNVCLCACLCVTLFSLYFSRWMGVRPMDAAERGCRLTYSMDAPHEWPAMAAALIYALTARPYTLHTYMDERNACMSASFSVSLFSPLPRERGVRCDAMR
uniref:Uncharacterized protein n=1 Tax=Vitrella brassicaformis TaxID=1169539 RepID=A0A7S1NZF3_9ALVE